MSENNKRTHWIIPDGFIPPQSSGDQPSHESICILNANKESALLDIVVYFEDRPPLRDIEKVVEGERSAHIRTSSLEYNKETIPVGVPYSIEVKSSQPIIVQYSRLDSTQPELALMSTMGFPLN